MFGSDHYGIRPDIITIAKGLTSAYAPLSGSIIGDKVWKVLEQGTDENGPIGHGWTYSAHPIGAAAGIANLKLVDSLGLVAQRRRRPAPTSHAALRDALADHPHVGDIRGDGMLAAIEFVEDRDARRFFDPSRKVGPAVAAALLARGVIARAMPQGDILGFAPPLCLTRARGRHDRRKPSRRRCPRCSAEFGLVSVDPETVAHAGLTGPPRDRLRLTARKKAASRFQKMASHFPAGFQPDSSPDFFSPSRGMAVYRDARADSPANRVRHRRGCRPWRGRARPRAGPGPRRRRPAGRTGQRVRKTQPDGGFDGLGMSPVRICRLPRARRVGRGDAGEQRARYRDAAGAA